MFFVKINETLYPMIGVAQGRTTDKDWDNRASKAVTLEMGYAEANALFVDGLAWSIMKQTEVPVFEQDENGEYVLDENGEPIQTGTEMQMQEIEDCGEFNLAGDLTDHRDGTITVKLGKLTDLEEAYEIMLGGM